MVDITKLMEKLQEYGYTVDVFNNRIARIDSMVNGISPSIRIENINELDSIDEAFAYCVQAFEQPIPNEVQEFREDAVNADYVLNNIRPVLLPKEIAEEQGLYYESGFANVVVAFYLMKQIDDCVYTSKMRSGLKEFLGIEDGLTPIALEHIKNEVYSKGVLQELVENGIMREECLQDEELASRDMTVVSVENKRFGASAILLLLNELENGTIVLPSSIHEMLILPTGTELNAEALNDMVEAGNSNLIPKDILAYTAFVVENGTLKEVA